MLKYFVVNTVICIEINSAIVTGIDHGVNGE